MAKVSGSMTLKVLKRISNLNCVSYGLHLYLAMQHSNIFTQELASNKDYVVVSYDKDTAREFLEKFNNSKKYLPKPEIQFFSEKKDAMIILRKNPHAVLGWRYSPGLELMY